MAAPMPREPPKTSAVLVEVGFWFIEILSLVGGVGRR
jgi:hypothetical protein